MKIRKQLAALVMEIADEADRNPAFAERIGSILTTQERSGRPGRGAPETTTAESDDAAGKRPKNRRTPAVLDPVHLARQGEDVLRTELGRLDLEQLRDVVAQYGMDTGKLVAKWRQPDRVVDRIVEMARLRAQKGNAFRDLPADPSDPDDASSADSRSPDGADTGR